jgi:hypothetical protein
MGGQVLQAVSVPANSRVDIMTGTPHEFPDARGNRVTVAAVSEAAGGRITVSFGSKMILEEGRLTLVGANVNPVIPDNVVGSGGALPGERIRVFLINTTGAAVVMSALVDLS